MRQIRLKAAGMIHFMSCRPSITAGVCVGALATSPVSARISGAPDVPMVMPTLFQNEETVLRKPSMQMPLAGTRRPRRVGNHAVDDGHIRACEILQNDAEYVQKRDVDGVAEQEILRDVHRDLHSVGDGDGLALMLELVAPELGGEAAEHGGDERDEREGRHRVDVAEDVLEPVDVDRACAVQSEALRVGTGCRRS